MSFPAPQFSPPRTPQPFTVPSAPVTRRMLAVETASAPVELPPTARRAPTFPSYTHETPSLAPVAMSTSVGLASRGAADRTMQLRSQPRSQASTMILAGLLAAAFAGIAVAVVLFVPSAVGHGRVSSLIGRTHQAPVAAAQPTIIPATPIVAPPPSAPAIVPAALAPAPSEDAAPVSVDALPKAEIAPNMTRLTLPTSAKGHRIFVDGRVVASGTEPITIKCGKHKIQVGSSGKPRITQLPCGGELTLD